MTGRISNDKVFGTGAQEVDATAWVPLTRSHIEQDNLHDISSRLLDALPGALMVTGSMGFAALAITGLRYFFG